VKFNEKSIHWEPSCSTWMNRFENANFTLSEPCTVIHICEKDQQDAPLSH